jgi:excisionase family DNA binding protein
MGMGDGDNLLVSVRTAAQMLCLSERTLYNLEQRGELVAVKATGRAKRYSVDTLRRWIEKKEAASGKREQ